MFTWKQGLDLREETRGLRWQESWQGDSWEENEELTDLSPEYKILITCLYPPEKSVKLILIVKQEVLHWNLISIATYEDIVPAKISLSRPTLHALYPNSRLFSFEPPRLWNHSLSNRLEKFGAKSFWEKISPVSLSLHLMVATVNYHMSDQVFRQKWKSFSHPKNVMVHLVWMKICYFFLLEPFPEKRFEGSSVSDGVFHNEYFDHQIWHLPQHHLQGVHLKAPE